MKSKLVLFLCLLSITVWAQPKKVTTSIDTTKNKIGAEFKLILKTDVDTLSKVKFPESKFFGALEVIQSYKIWLNSIRFRKIYYSKNSGYDKREGIVFR